MMTAFTIPHWRTAPRHLSLEPSAVHVWRIDTSECGLNPSDGWPLLTAAQRTRITALRDERNQRRSIRAQAGLNRILAHYLDCAPTAIPLQRHAQGKPYLAGDAAWLTFSLSHSGDLAIVGIGASEYNALGVDCEQIRPRGDVLAIAQRMFLAENVHELTLCPESTRLEHFLYLWTALEADVKCDGRGLFRPRPPEAIAPQIAHIIPAAGYIAAVARQTLPPVADWQYLELEDTD